MTKRPIIVRWRTPAIAGLVAAAVTVGLVFTPGAKAATSTAESMALSSSPNPSRSGDGVTFTVQAAPGAAPLTPGDSVHFQDLSNSMASVGDATVDRKAHARLIVSSLAPGYHQVGAVTIDNGGFRFSNLVTQAVTAPVTSISLSSSPEPSEYGQSVTLAVEVVPGDSSPSPIGDSVHFQDLSDNLASLGDATVGGNGRAIVVTTSLAVGTHQIGAVMVGPGDGPYSSNLVTQVVAKADTQTSVSSSRNPSGFGQQVVFTALVRPSAGTGVPGGTVTFKDGSTTLRVANLDGSGSASISTSSLSLGSHAIAAIYDGDAHYKPSTSNVVTENIEICDPTDAICVPSPLTPA